MEAPNNLEPLQGTKARQRTQSGSSIPRPDSTPPPPPDPPGPTPLEVSNKKQKLNQVMNMLQGRAVERYTEALNQTKPPEVNDLIWLRPSRVAKQEMDLSGISLHSPWILVTLTKQEEEQSKDSTTWFFALTGLEKTAKVTQQQKETNR